MARPRRTAVEARDGVVHGRFRPARAADHRVEAREQAVTARENEVADREEPVAQVETAAAQAGSEPLEDGAEAVPVEVPTGGNPLMECAGTNDYNHCIIQTIRDPRTPREFAAVIEAYRGTGQRQRSCTLMSSLVSRHPSTREARLYSQNLERQCD